MQSCKRRRVADVQIRGENTADGRSCHGLRSEVSREEHHLQFGEKSLLIAEVAVAFALLNLSQVLREPVIEVSQEIECFYEDIEWLQMELRSIELFLRFADKKIWVGEEACISLAHTRDVANKAETIASKFAFIRDEEMQNDGRCIQKSYTTEAKVCLSLLRDTKREFKELKILISEIKYPSSHNIGVEEPGKPLISSPSTLNALGKQSRSDILKGEEFVADMDIDVIGNLEINEITEEFRANAFFKKSEEVISFENHINCLKDQLYSDKLELDVVGVVGMGGVGKTTLASLVFKSIDVELFPIRVWLDLSQNNIELQGIQSLLREIAKQTNPQTEDLKGESTRELSELVERNLKGKRYLIVMDDMWEEEVWDLIKDHLPDESNASRIMITTRNENVARRPASHSDPYKLQCLNEKESWNFFTKIIFGNEERLNRECTGLLLTQAKELVDKCGGSPLALDCLINSLSGKDKTHEAWKYALENEEWQKRCVDTLKLSYTCLPIHLKWGFLYLCSFPEDSKIEVERLIKLWVAEGFVKMEDHDYYDDEEETWEDIAEGYLEDLKQRCLVIVEDAIQASEFVSFCYIPKILRALGINEAKETGFMDGLSCFSISSQPNLTFTEMWMRFEEVIWLRVLDLQGLDIGDLPEQVGDMAQLRYLNVRSSRCKLPDSICRLSKLETLDCRVEAAEPITIPDDVWKIPTLTHVHGNGLRCNFDVSHLVKLQTVGSLLLNSWIGKSILNFTRLRKLDIYIETEYKGKGDMIDECWKSLQELSYLKVLCFNLNGYENIDMTCSEGGFPSLLRLTLVNYVLESWVVKEGSMPFLEFLQLESCPNLIRLPSGLEHRTTLPRLFYTKMGENFNQWVKSNAVWDATTISGIHPLDVQSQVSGVTTNINEVIHPLDVQSQASGVTTNIDEGIHPLDVQSQASSVTTNINEGTEIKEMIRERKEIIEERPSETYKLLIRELDVGHELTRRLENNIDHRSCPVEVKALLQDILNSWERCRSLAVMPKAEMQVVIDPTTAGDSPRSFCGSSELDSVDIFKKRKMLPKWTSRVHACYQSGSEMPPDDGHSWRKYGEKDILGAKFPRAYFRCTHRHTRGCMATKYIQRSDENPSLFDVMYERNHTCVRSSPSQMLLAATPQDLSSQGHTNSAILYGNSDNQPDVKFSNSLTVDDLVSQDLVTGPFSFPSSPVSGEQLENYIFSQSSTPES